ncbi:MAG TPA: APC family permease [Candidatus Acidoferrales bacterium]|nr:APC family permease [Candidatus Acidoferrales bacterium]
MGDSRGAGSPIDQAEAVPALRREMGLRDVTLFAITCIVGTRWIPAAAHAGPGSVTLWLLAAVLFMVPLAVAVAALAVKYPGTGGLYLWTRNDFGPWHGFLCFWSYWIGIAFLVPSAAMFYMSAGAYTLGASYAHLADNRLYLVVASLVAIWLALGTNLVGIRIGKWTENLGAAATWVLGAVLIVAATLLWSKRGSATAIHIAPTWSWETISFWAIIAYAMSGLEMAGLMGGEIHRPERTLPRAGWIASGIATLFYASTTVALLVILRPEKISEMNGLAEAGETAAQSLGVAWLGPAIAVLVMASAVGQFGGWGTSVSRLPFVVGVDHLLPAAFGKVHPRWGTPHISILVFGGVASFLLVAIQLGDTMRAAYQTLVSLMVVTGFLPYLYIFGSAWKAGKRWSPISGWGITLLAILTSIVPTAEVTNVWLFETKIAVGTAAVIATAWLLYRRR